MYTQSSCDIGREVRHFGHRYVDSLASVRSQLRLGQEAEYLVWHVRLLEILDLVVGELDVDSLDRLLELVHLGGSENGTRNAYEERARES